MTTAPHLHLSDTALSALATGQADDTLIERIEAHLLRCNACGERFDHLIRNDALVHRIKPTPIDATPVCESNATWAATALKVGDSVGPYGLREVLGKGGMGVVYLAHDKLIERDVAVKVLSDSVSHDPAARARFLAEARAQGKLNHQNVVTIYTIQQTDSMMYIVMEYLSGGSLADRLVQGALPWRDATAVAMQACRGLSAAHAAGLIHRDVKPANLLLDSHGQTQLSDFGVAKARNGASLTAAGEIVGTPHFMSPEQTCSDQIDLRSDLYQLGATYYTLLTGVKPYGDFVNPVEVMQAHCEFPVPDPRRINPRIPSSCAAMVARAMQKDPDGRYETADEMFEDLQAAQEGLALCCVTRSISQSTEKSENAEKLSGQGETSQSSSTFIALLGIALLVLLG